MKEAIKILLPIFLGFLITHLFMIFYGITRHGQYLPQLLNSAQQETLNLNHAKGLFFTLALFLHAYAIGGGTYTGLEAVSNNVNVLKKPRQKTGHWTMGFMAFSLSFTAAGIMTLYLLWSPKYSPELTLNAVVFRSILYDWPQSELIVSVTLLFEFGLLFVGANTGFLGGPAVLANMAVDDWLPHMFRNLSSQLVNQNGIIIFGLAAILILMASNGHIDVLIILYSINVFLAFSISILGLCRHWLKLNKGFLSFKFLLALLAFLICSIILTITVVSQLFSGGFEALLLTFSVVFICLYVKSQYNQINRKTLEADKIFVPQVKQTFSGTDIAPPKFNSKGKTAVFFIKDSKGVGLHTVLWVQRLFPNIFDNFIFVSIGIIDVESFGAEKKLQKMKDKVDMLLSFFKEYANQHNIASKTYCAYDIDPVAASVKIANEITRDLPECVFFASQLVIENSNFITKHLKNFTAFEIQRHLHLNNHKMMILPMKLY